MLPMSLPTRLRILFPKQRCCNTGGHHYHQRNRQHQHHHRAQLRRIVTSSIPPSQHAFIERPETIILVESSLYNKNNNNSLSWKDAGSTIFPMCGLHFASIDLFHSVGGTTSTTSLESLEQTLVNDLSHIGSNSVLFISTHDDGGDDDDENINQLLSPSTSFHSSSSSAHVVLIAKGPIQCLIAQYYLESNPLAGLVLVDPILLPENGREQATTKTRKKDGGSRNSNVDGRWETLLSKFMSVLMVKNMEVAAGNATTANATNVDPPLLLPIPNEVDTTLSSSSPKATEELEIKFLHSLLQSSSSSSSQPLPSSTTTSSTPQQPRPLKLEPNSVPILVLYSGDHLYEEYYRGCAEWTAAFHAGSTTTPSIANTTVLPYQQSRVGSGGGGGGGESAMVWKIPKPSGGTIRSRNWDNTKQKNNDDDDDVNSLMMRIYEWYDEMVA